MTTPTPKRKSAALASRSLIASTMRPTIGWRTTALVKRLTLMPSSLEPRDRVGGPGRGRRQIDLLGVAANFIRLFMPKRVRTSSFAGSSYSAPHQDDERVGQRPPAHEGERRTDLTARNPALDLFGGRQS